MKSAGEGTTVEGVCRLLGRSNLLAPGEVHALEKRWRTEAKEQADLEEFARWLVAQRYVTEYQMTKLLHGHFDHFFLGEHKLLDKIARDRSARVYKAINRIGQLAAIKVLPPSQARDPQAVARFEREARLGTKLDHPNVVRLLGSGESAGLHYIVMEYLEGETLQSVLARQGRLPVVEAVDVVCQALAGLQHLMEHGLIHRNLSPASLLLQNSPAGREAVNPPLLKLLDLSLCREAAESGAGPNRGEEELVLATPYPAPELMREPHRGDIRGDVFSLGCVLYHTLSGASPFPSPGSGRHSSRAFSRPIRPLREATPEVSEELAAQVARMMARDPAERFATPSEAANALATAIEQRSVVTVEMEPISLPTPPPPPPPPPPPAWSEDEEFAAPSAVESTETPIMVNPALQFTEEAPAPEASSRVAKPPTRRVRQRWVEEPRDWLLLLIGAGGLLIVQAIAWLIARLVG